METVIERIGGRKKVVVKHDQQAFILQCNESDVEYIKHCFDIMIDRFRKECYLRNSSEEIRKDHGKENYEALNKLSIEDLIKLNAMVVEVLKEKQSKIVNTKKRE